jgi:hypothetical protein
MNYMNILHFKRMDFCRVPKELAPTLFKLARKKNMSVANAISGCVVYCTYPAHKKYSRTPSLGHSQQWTVHSAVSLFSLVQRILCRP